MKLRRVLAAGIALLILLAVVVAAIALRELRRNNQRPSVWLDAPLAAKVLSIKLEAQRLWHKLDPPRREPERYAHVTAEVVENAMRQGADFLLRMQNPSGRFKYWYDPAADSFSPPQLDNFLRQAGTGYALMQVYEMTGDVRHLDAARKNLAWLMRYRKTLDDDKSYFLFQEKAKLGGIALPMLTMLKLRELTGTREHDDELRRLARMIFHLQDQYGTGQFKSTYVFHGDANYEQTSGWESQMYPGEAMLALAAMYRAFGDAEYRARLDWALEFYAPPTRWKRHSFLPWTIQAFCLMYEQTRDRRYADYALRLTDHLLTQQNLDPDDEVYGSFHGIPTINTSSYMEGLADAVRLAALLGERPRETGYAAQAKMGYRWILELRVSEQAAAGFKRPDRAVGGFRKSLYDPQLRIDNTQHSIACLAKGLRWVYGRPPAVVP